MSFIHIEAVNARNAELRRVADAGPPSSRAARRSSNARASARADAPDARCERPPIAAVTRAAR